MAVIEEVVIQTVETPFGIIAEHAVLICVLCGDAGMIMPFLIRILYEENIIDDAEQCIFEKPVFVRVLLSGKVFFYLFLSVDK